MESVRGQKPLIFYIGPEEDAGGLYAAIQKPLEEAGYRLDSWKHPAVGSLTREIVRSLDIAFAVLADVRQPNANVYYEIGLAHAFKTPVIPFILEREKPPFDIQDEAAVEVTMDGVEIRCEDSLVREIK